MQPSLDNATHGVTLIKGEAAAGLGVPVNDERFWKRRAEDVPVDQRFFHAFFVRKDERDRQKARKVAKRKGKGDASDSEELSGEDEDEDERSEGEEAASQEEEMANDDEEVESGDESEDGGFDLPSKGKKPSPAEGEDEEEDSDTEEAEIWKVCRIPSHALFIL